MSARYIVRFDDLCPAMNWTIWDRLEPTLRRHGVKPIVAVVPDNQDPSLVVEAPRNDFWHRVRDWQSAGWTIALHGYQHTYVTPDAGLMGINAFSEFAGLTEDVQRDKLNRAMQIFEREGVRADAWVAPAHSFDQVTVRLLLQAGIDVISDGFFRRVVRHFGATWVPQQLWRFRNMPLGLWTVCYHHNNLTEAGLFQLSSDIERYSDRIVGVEQVARRGPAAPHQWHDEAFAACWRTLLKTKQHHASR